MAILGISPEFLSYLERVAQSERVIWHADLRFLYCFSEKFSGNDDELIFSGWNGMFDLAFFRYKEARSIDSCSPDSWSPV